ncbi:Xanthine dehydrogenase/oxidase [Geodia barretti]|nr:Xanthine dehydrogenase/oxidase [Geodia barretti]
MLRWFAGQQIRNTASIGGNICNASPISDLNPVLMACGAKLHLASQGSKRVITLDSNFFLDYKKTCIKPNEVLVAILIPFTAQNEYVYSYKQSRRREDDLAIVNAGLRVVINGTKGQWRIRDCTLVYGGMSKTTVMASNTQQALIGREWNEATLQEATRLLSEELQLSWGCPWGHARVPQVSGHLILLQVLPDSLPPPLSSLSPSTSTLWHTQIQQVIITSSQGFQRVPCDQKAEDMVGRPVMHLSAPQQATGEARYLDDVPRLEGELYGGLVLSQHAHAIISVDASAALVMEGVVDYVSVTDVPGDNMIGINNDEPVFADGKVMSFGQIIGVVLATDKPLAQRAAKAVRVTYEDIHPPVITIEDAIRAGWFIGEEMKVEDGDVEKALSEAEHVLEGEVRVGGQDHFYLETQACLVVPKGEQEEVEILSSTQGVTAVQTNAARGLGIPRNRVVSKVKRIGGGFGGKETRGCYLSTAVAVAANKVQRPVRIMLDRNEDMMTSGGRHPFLGVYKVGFTSQGRITALDLKLYSNGGISADLSIPVMQRAVTHADNVYKIPNYRAVGKVCRTNLPPNTAFRGFGGPQGMIITEQWIERVAEFLKLPSEQVRRLNFYHDGDATPYGQIQPKVHVSRCWDTLLENTHYLTTWRSSVDLFNK